MVRTVAVLASAFAIAVPASSLEARPTSAGQSCTARTARWQGRQGAEYGLLVRWCWSGSVVISHSANETLSGSGRTGFKKTSVLIGSGGNGSADWQAVRQVHWVNSRGHGFWEPVVWVKVSGDGSWTYGRWR